MKISTTENRIPKHLVMPIPFFPKKDNSLSPADSNSKRDHEATTREVRYDYTNPDSLTYKVYLSPFDHGSPEEWLKFHTKLNLIIQGNGLTTGPNRYNLMCALLKGKALCHFNNKVQELDTATVAHHTECMQAVTEHIFPKNALQTQKRHLHSPRVRLNQNTSVNEFFAQWRELNNYLALFPPHGGEAQKFCENEIIETYL
jgi:hypothetical protein